MLGWDLMEGDGKQTFVATLFFRIVEGLVRNNETVGQVDCVLGAFAAMDLQRRQTGSQRSELLNLLPHHLFFPIHPVDQVILEDGGDGRQRRLLVFYGR